MQQGCGFGAGLFGSGLLGAPAGGLFGLQSQQQASRQPPLTALLSGFGEAPAQEFAQRGFAGSLETQLLVASHRESVSKRPKSCRDYSENLTKREEKVPSFEDRI
jgi:hypothetical protein